jgi:hypothetical protein
MMATSAGQLSTSGTFSSFSIRVLYRFCFPLVKAGTDKKEVPQQWRISIERQLEKTTEILMAMNWVNHVKSSEEPSYLIKDEKENELISLLSPFILASGISFVEVEKHARMYARAIHVMCKNEPCSTRFPITIPMASKYQIVIRDF